ncbi:MAG: glycosyltransferase [Deltaproteobacteria bacterium]|nr:glycosyltransferase [Deltaproteobacteria bacterium]
MKPVVIIPTLNENEGIVKLITGILNENLNLDVLVIDGHSEDGTFESVKAFSEKNPHVSIIRQSPNAGFGEALRQGFQIALNRGYDPIITMDGDLSHGPEYLNHFLQASKDYDLVVGSRYINGVRVEGWKFRKLFFSKLANMFVSYVLVKPIWDFTSGFRCYHRAYLESLDLNCLNSIGYIVQIQLLYLAFHNRYRVKEIPIIFKGMHGHTSKVSKSRHPKRKTLFHVLKYRAPILEILRHLTYLKKDYQRFVEEYDELLNLPKLKQSGREYPIKDRPSVSVGVMAHNEENIIGRCLDSLINQKIQMSTIKEIIVVSSGSTDATDEIVKSYAKKNTSIRLIIQPERLGKASAINAFLSRAKGEIAVLISADVVPEPHTVEALISPFSISGVGMTGAHPIPQNTDRHFVGFCVNKY